MKRKIILFLLVLLQCGINFPDLLFGQDFLPPNHPWKGQSEQLITNPQDPWITPIEQSHFSTTPDYKTTMEWLEKLAISSEFISLKTIGVSGQVRPIQMVIVSADPSMHSGINLRSDKPNVLVQAGIHSGEIDGKDAGMMLLRDIAFGGKEKLIDQINLLFIPILSVDAHEKSGPYHRPNQRGPENMGWRTNARNLNLNRDYTKLETEEVRAVLYAINAFDPVMYIDIHVTDGADYQYDITYSRPAGNKYSPTISQWLRDTFSSEVDSSLTANGHIPGPLIFAANDENFNDGIVKWAMPLRFSDGYGDARHLPSVLVENHSLKPYRQRVLGTYVFLEQMLISVSRYREELVSAISSDRVERPDSIVLRFGFAKENTDSIELALYDHEEVYSDITQRHYVQWGTTPIRKKVPFKKMDHPQLKVEIPEAYYIPVQWIEVIRKLSGHGIQMEMLAEEQEIELVYNYIDAYEIDPTPVEGRFRFKDVKLSERNMMRTLPRGSVRIPTDQPLGKLAVLLLEPEAADSFFQWGYFNAILSRTEYIEGYVLEPMIREMLDKNLQLRESFEDKKRADPDFASDGQKIFQWFYAQTPYFDTDWKIIPVGRQNRSGIQQE